MLARSQAPFLMFALFSVGCGTGIASLVLTIPRFGLAGGAIVSTAIGILMAMTGGGLISWFASHFERPVQPQRRHDILDDLEDDRDR
ncbi:MAG TPA: hypothetical protein VM510_09140 [Caulifigura sp.]|nr:hypothetical protein [Caulifigura sp.]